MEVSQAARELGLTHTIARWLLGSGHSDLTALRTFLDPKLKSLTSPDGMVDRDAAARRLAQAIRNRERIVVFGDYDCDGITSAAIMTQVLEALGGRVKPMLASRFDGGYGVSPAASERILSLSPSVLVTCDCGSSDHHTLGPLGQRGVDIIVIDHHLVPAEPLPAVAFLNPHRPDCGFAYKGLASCGLALSIAAALRKELGRDLDIRQWLDLVAIGTIADVAPLDGDNRTLVRAGLLTLQKAQRPGVRALLSLAKITGETPLTGRDVAFRLAPHLNAPGRMGAPDLALQLLLARNDEEAGIIAEEIEQISQSRRQQQATILEQAVEEIERSGFAQQPAIVVGQEGWNPGVVGIVAGKLADRYCKPVVVIGFDNGIGRGSARGPTGSRLYDALCQTKDCLERFGGHQAAAGLEVKSDNLVELRTNFAAAVEAQGPLVATTSHLDHIIDLEACDHPFDVLGDLDRLEPCGERNTRPRVRILAQVATAREVKGGHLKLELDLGRAQPLGCFAVNEGSRAPELKGRVRVIGDLRHTTFPGSGGVEMFVEELALAPQ